jgi:hypothetical protein
MADRARWEDVLDVQVRILDLARSGLLGFPTRPQITSQLPPLLPEALARAEPVFVSRDVFDAWQFACAAFEPDPVTADDPFVPSGFALLPRPLDMIREGTDEPASAILWTPDRGAIFVGGFTVGERRRWSLSSVLILPLERTPSQVLEEAAGMPGWMQEVPDEDQKLIRQWRLLQSLWSMARQFVRAPERPDRAQRRRAGRVGLRHDQAVTVVRLRRTRREPSADEREVEWSCRWVVRGHWRKLSTGRQTWVRAHVKGPDGLPLRVTDRVSEFVR